MKNDFDKIFGGNWNDEEPTDKKDKKYELFDKHFGPPINMPESTDKKGMGNYLLRELINVVSALIVSYLIVVFVLLEFNIFGWTESERVISLLVSAILYSAIKLSKII